MTQEPLEEELVERVARIICAEFGEDPDGVLRWEWDLTGRPRWNAYAREARNQILSYRAIAAYDMDAKHLGSYR